MLCRADSTRGPNSIARPFPRVGGGSAARWIQSWLTSFSRGTLIASGNNGVGLDAVTIASDSQSWNLNAVGDQSSVTTNGTATPRTNNAKNELTAVGSTSLSFDHNGNTTTDENDQTYTYDARNRSITVKNSGGTAIAVYSYDPQGLRITEASADTTTDVYFTNQWQAMEERQAGTVTRQNVWGEGYVNQLIERDDNSVSGTLGISGSGLGQRLYDQQDANWNSTSLVDNSGNVVQRMTFGSYGAVTFLTATWSATTDAYATNVLFQGGRFSPATGNYKFDNRDDRPTTGDWEEPDPAEYVNGADLFIYCDTAPVSHIDPAGTDSIISNRLLNFIDFIVGSPISACLAATSNAEIQNQLNARNITQLGSAKGGNANTLQNGLTYGNLSGAAPAITNVVHATSSVTSLGLGVGGPSVIAGSEAESLVRKLASEEQTGEALAGRGMIVINQGELDVAGQLAQRYGGHSNDWVKMSSASSAIHCVQGPAGNFETHWYQNLVTHQVVEIKTKIAAH